MNIRPTINVAIFGCVSVGKSTFLNMLMKNMFSDCHIKRTPDSRVQDLNSSNTFIDFKLEFAKKVDDCYAMEKELHLLLAEYRVRPDREFFKCPLEEIKDMFDGLG